MSYWKVGFHLLHYDIIAHIINQQAFFHTLYIWLVHTFNTLEVYKTMEAKSIPRPSFKSQGAYFFS